MSDDKDPTTGSAVSANSRVVLLGTTRMLARSRTMPLEKAHYSEHGTGCVRKLGKYAGKELGST
jgi:hypothetical protein